MARSVRCPVLVGREHELEALTVAWREVAAGRGRTVLVEGDAGIGKSRLVERFVEVVRERGGTVLEGACVPFLEAVPYAPLLAALDALPAEARDTPAPERGYGQLPDSSQRARFFQRVADGLANLSGGAPVVLVVEDLQWADDATADLLLFLARGRRALRLQLVGTWRSDEPPRAVRLGAALTELVRAGRAERIRLAPLPPPQTIELLAGIIHGSPTREQVRQVVDRAEGNPLFVEELVAAGDATEPPASVHELIVDRVSRVLPVTRKVLHAAAVIGRRADDRLLALVSDLPAEELDAALREAVSHHLLDVDAAAGGYAFRHALIHESVDRQLLPGERRALHERAAATLTDHSDWSMAAGNAAAVAAELASHWYLAGRVSQAWRSSLDAAWAADAAHAPAEAHIYFGRALQLWDHVSEADTAPSIRREDVVLAAADAASLAGLDPQAQALVRDLVDKLDPERDPDLHVLALRAMALYMWRGGKARESQQAAADIEARLPALTGRARAHALQALSFVYGSQASGGRYAARALDAARTTNDPSLMASALFLLGSIRADMGLDDGLGLLRESLQLSRTIGSDVNVARALTNLVHLLILHGRSEEALDLAEPGKRELQQLGLGRSVVPVLAAGQVHALVEIGRWDEADQLASAALSDTEPLAATGLLLAYARLLLRRGQYSEAAALLDAAATNIDQDHDVTRGAALAARRAELYLWQGDWTAARSALQRGRALFGEQTQAAGWLLRLCQLAARLEADEVEAYRLAGQPVDASTHHAAALDHVAVATSQLNRIEDASGSQCPAFHLLLESVQAEAARLADPPDFERWAAVADASPSRPYLMAYARWREAESLSASRGPRRRTTDSLRVAYKTAAQLGATPLLKRIADIAARARVEITAPQQTPEEQAAPPAANLGLTEREIEVLRLIGNGLSNRQIAQTLYISPKTASVHVSNILRKLEINSRVQAAAIAHRTGLLQGQ